MFKKIIYHFSTVEKIVAILLVILILFCSGQVIWAFYKEHSHVIPASGDIYREGIIGELQLLNPVFSLHNDVDRDISRLLFSGLIRYNPKSKTLEDDIATHVLSLNKKVYTFTIRDNAKWHDDTPVTADDIIFTYQNVIKSELFANASLRDSFKDVAIEKIDDRTVTFTLKRPYKFFLANLTIGLLPKHLLDTVPIENLEKSELNLMPIGTGPYMFNRIVKENNRIDVYLDKYDNYYIKEPFVESVIISIFPNYDALYAKIDEINGIQNVPKDLAEKVENHGKFQVFPYELNQYVALFLNMDNKKIKDVKTRLGLQLSTNKEVIAKELSNVSIIDTPLLEISKDDWKYQFDPIKAAGAFYDSQWKVPEPSADPETEPDTPDTDPETEPDTPDTDPETEPREASHITEPNEGQDWITQENSFFIKGTVPDGTSKVIVNDYTLNKFKRGHTTWAYKVDTSLRNLSEGENVYEIHIVNLNGEKSKIDEIKVEYYSDDEKFNEAVKKAATPETEESDTEETPPEETKTEKEIEREIKAKLKEVEGIIRQNEEGETLSFQLITTSSPPEYEKVAYIIKEQWLKAGVDIQIEILDTETFIDRLTKREYDILLFGQNLGYNLDAYPYWHSSQTSKNGGFNLSEYKSLKSDVLIEEIRATHDEEVRKKNLEELQVVIRDDVPAIFLYTPVYKYAVDSKIHNAEAKNLAISSDRFNNIEEWYIKMHRAFNDNASIWDFFPWVLDQTFGGSES